MPINPEKFILKMINKFDGKYNLPHDILVDVIVTVLNDAPDLYFTYDMVQEHPEFCRKCGSCCRQRDMDCEYFNGRTCDEYYTRKEYCAEFPYYEIDTNGVGRGLILDPGCNFALKLAEMVLDTELKKQELSLNDY